MNTKDDNIQRSSARRPPSKDEVGLRAVAEVGRLKGGAGTAALREGLAAHNASKDRYSVTGGDKLKDRVQKLYDKKVKKRKQLAAPATHSSDGVVAYKAIEGVKSLLGR